MIQLCEHQPVASPASYGSHIWMLANRKSQREKQEKFSSRRQTDPCLSHMGMFLSVAHTWSEAAASYVGWEQDSSIKHKLTQNEVGGRSMQQYKIGENVINILSCHVGKLLSQKGQSCGFLRIKTFCFKLLWNQSIGSSDT